VLAIQTYLPGSSDRPRACGEEASQQRALVALASASNTVTLWAFDARCEGQPQTGCAAELGTSGQLSAYAVSSLAFHPDLELLLAASLDGTVRMLSAAPTAACTLLATMLLPDLLQAALRSARLGH
jgi:WD40 repeat protein